jgi:hypothetical protein
MAPVIVLTRSVVGNDPFIPMPHGATSTNANAGAVTLSPGASGDALLDSIEVSLVADSARARPVDVNATIILAEVRRRSRPYSALLWDTERDGYTQAKPERLWTVA